MPDRISGIPAHPLLVHLPVVLLPVVALLALLLAFRPQLAGRYGWPIVALSGLGALSAIVAAESGEGLERILNEHSPAIEHHAEWGDRTKMAALFLFVLVAAFVFVTKRKHARRPVGPAVLATVVAVLMGVAAIGTAYAVFETGHSGAKSAWEDAGKEG